MINTNTNSRKRIKSSSTTYCSCKTLVFIFFILVAIVCFACVGILIHNNHDTIIIPSQSINYISKSLANAKYNTIHLRSSPKATTATTPIITTTHPKERRKRYAYAITITKDGFFQDGAAVLAYSIMKYSQYVDYDISFIAFIHPNVTTSRPGLTRLGFHVIEVPIPINVSAIQFDFLREKINKNGCCGSSELIKLASYRLMQYDRVIHLDADVILLNPIDELFHKNYSLIYTTDPNMATFKGEDKMPVQGGFIVLQPSIDDYRSIINTLMTTEFRKYHGWNTSHIGWFWGGMTVQGILPYYYNRVTIPGRSLIVNRCYYNTMADTPECNNQTLSELKSAHFTVCQKPWGCFMNIDTRLCRSLHQEWFRLRLETEKFYGIQSPPEACNRGGGHKNYHTMLLDQAIFPSTSKKGQDQQKGSKTIGWNVIPDDSMSRLDPLPESKYQTVNYD